MSGLDKLEIPVKNSDFETVPVGTMAKLDKADELAAWRDNVLELWASLPERPGPGELMALGNVLRDAPDYSYERKLAQQRERWKREYLTDLSQRLQKVLRDYL